MNDVIHFPDDFLPHIDMWRDKGFANLEVSHEGSRYRLSFVDLYNTEQGLKGQGDDAGHFAEPGMVVVQEISEDIIRRAVNKLARSGYFANMAPVSGSG